MNITLGEVLAYFDEQVPNQYEASDKIKWLSEIEERIFNNIIKTHHGAEGVNFNGYNEQTDINTVMLVDSAYSELYRYWLEKSVHYANREIPSFNNAMSMYANYYEDYYCYYNRTHRPISAGKFKV